MPDLKQFRLPDVGEGLTEADILSWSVEPGETVVVNQILVEVETAKAAVELPSPFAGVVQALHAQAGETVEVGRPIITIDVAPDAATAAADLTAPANRADEGEAVAAPQLRQAVLVGYGPRVDGPVRRGRRTALPAQHEPAAGVPATGVLASPPVRKLAKSLGLDLAAIPATGPNGSVSRGDVQLAASQAAGPVAGFEPVGTGGREERIPVRGVRKHTARAMVSSAFTAPHVGEFVTADVTAMMDLRQRIKARREFADVKVTPLLFVAKALLWAVRRTPIINSAWDEAAGEIVVKHYVNLGIAAATGRGLLVPNVKDADAMTLRQLAGALSTLTETARAGRTTAPDMAGGSITLTNIGVFGVDAGTPIINPGEAAILALGAIRRAPWVVQRNGREAIEPRWVTTLSLSFDHRVVDGQQGSSFLADIACVLSDPGLALL